MFYCFNIVATTEWRVKYVFHSLKRYNLFLGVYEEFFLSYFQKGNVKELQVCHDWEQS